MWNKPTIKQLAKIPKLYSQDGVKDPKVYMKFFIGPTTWYVTEFDGVDTFYGLVINDADPEMAEFGYFSFRELLTLKMGYSEVDRDLHSVTPYSPKKLSFLKKRHYMEHGL